ncbi:hypothetical protein GCM10027259_60700 [Micromonospora palomenae]
MIVVTAALTSGRFTTGPPQQGPLADRSSRPHSSLGPEVIRGSTRKTNTNGLLAVGSIVAEALVKAS